ncbi:MAG: T9SS type A sorting domain-containing protein [Bacteroidia bacterium]
MGNLTDYFMVFTDGNVDANWQGATKGFVGNVVIDGIQADERTSGTVPYAGTIYTNDVSLGAWQNIVNSNSGQATGSYNNTTLINTLTNSLESCFSQINALTVTSGYEGVSSTSLNGLNTQNGITERFVINITSGFSVSSKINITGDASDVFFLRWDSDANFADGYEGEVKFQSGGAIVPLGGLLACNFIHVAGDINSSGGGSNPGAPYPQGPRYINGTGALITNGSDFNGGGFFTGYWLTTGSPDIAPGNVQPYGKTGSLSNAIFVGGWYSKTTEFSMTSGTSGVYVNVQTALPVTWLSILALRNETGKVNINWATATEINNDYFTIEKSTDNRNFNEIGVVEGAGNKNSMSKYVFEDANPGAGTIYYRIKQTDFNGEFAYSAIVALNPGKLLNNVTMNPNPASSNVTITWDAGIREKLTLNITDLAGVVILSEPLSTSNNIHYLNIQDMNNGLYLINIVSNNDMVYRSRIVVTR